MTGPQTPHVICKIMAVVRSFPRGTSPYKVLKYCDYCNEWFFNVDVYCPCCNLSLRTKGRSLESHEKLLETTPFVFKPIPKYSLTPADFNMARQFYADVRKNRNEARQAYDQQFYRTHPDRQKEYAKKYAKKSRAFLHFWNLVHRQHSSRIKNNLYQQRLRRAFEFNGFRMFVRLVNL